MKNEEIIKSLRINHIFSVFAILLTIAAFETGVLQKEALGKLLSATWTYTLQVATIMLTVLLIPYAIKSFTKKLENNTANDSEERKKIFIKKSMQRIVILFAVVLLNTFTYYGIGYEGALYCGIAGLGALVYSFPTKSVLENYLEKENTPKR